MLHCGAPKADLGTLADNRKAAVGRLLKIAFYTARSAYSLFLAFEAELNLQTQIGPVSIDWRQ